MLPVVWADDAATACVDQECDVRHGSQNLGVDQAVGVGSEGADHDVVLADQVHPFIDFVADTVPVPTV